MFGFEGVMYDKASCMTRVHTTTTMSQPAEQPAKRLEDPRGTTTTAWESKKTQVRDPVWWKPQNEEKGELRDAYGDTFSEALAAQWASRSRQKYQPDVLVGVFGDQVTKDQQLSRHKRKRAEPINFTKSKTQLTTPWMEATAAHDARKEAAPFDWMEATATHNAKYWNCKCGFHWNVHRDEDGKPITMCRECCMLMSDGRV
jgi:hypothetical protein